MLASSAFIVTLLVAYYFNSRAKAFAQKRLQKWPELSAPLTFFVLACCFAVIVASFVLRGVTFVGPVTHNLAVAGVPASCVFSFTLWNRNRFNIIWLFLFLAVFLSAGIYAMVASAGRRLLLAVFLGPILCLYWSQVRYRRPLRVLAAVGLAATVVMSVSIVYQNFRWYSTSAQEHRTAKGVIQQLGKLRDKANVFDVFLANELAYLGQHNGHYALLTQRYIATQQITAVPLNTLRFLVAFPIPHNVWPDKPEVIGLTITRDVANLPYTNWGLGIAGQGAYEGGIAALMLYAVLLAFGVRILDEPMRLQPGNPFLIFMQTSALPHVLSIPRGDMGIMTINVIESVIFALLLGFACRVFFGTRQSASDVRSTRVPLQPGFSPGHRIVQTPGPRS
jgi:hypothetical protein